MDKSELFAVVREGGYMYVRVIDQDELTQLVRTHGDYAPRVVGEHLSQAEAEALASAECEKAREYYSN